MTELELVDKKSIMHFQAHTSKFVKIYTMLPRHITHLRALIEKGLVFMGSTFWTTTFESNMPHPLRFMIDNDMTGMSWIDLPKGSYSVRPRSYKKTTN